MKLLTFLARRFCYKTFSKTLPEVEDQDVDQTVEEAVVAYLHVEAADQSEERRPSVLRQTLKHLKWLANKRGLRNVVLHSFTHLGADSADPAFARALFEELAERLRNVDYQVWITPFGYFCEWELAVYGDSLAKVFKQI
jgi:hypothetical protein